MIRAIVFTLSLVVAQSVSAFYAHAHEAVAGEITITHPWARASLSAKVRNGASYLTLNNLGSKADRLISVSTHIADRAELHSHQMKGDVMKMRQLEAIEIPAGEMVELKPGGLHIMLMGLRTPLKKGLSFPMTLTFESAGEVDVEVVIETGTTRGDKMDHGEHMKK